MSDYSPSNLHYGNQWTGAASGWLCPRCNTVNAPTTPWCYSCAPPRAQVAKDTTGVNPMEHKPTTTSEGK